MLINNLLRTTQICSTMHREPEHCLSYLLGARTVTLHHNPILSDASTSERGSTSERASTSEHASISLHRLLADRSFASSAELGTSGSIDGQQRLVLKGRFTPKGVENIIRRYISEYVTTTLSICNLEFPELSHLNPLHSTRMTDCLWLFRYVTCKMCRSADTILTRDQSTRLYYMECQSCAAKRTVPPIKMGFQAQIGKRRAMKG